MDPSSREGAAALVQHVDDRFGRLDLLVNCLKSGGYSSFEATTNESFEAAVRADLGSVYFSIQSALRLMTARPKPRIVNVVSETSYECPLAASLREAIKELTRSLAKQLPRHYRLNGVEIGFETQPTDRGFDPELIREATGVSPDDAARAVLYLLSPEAKAVNGQIIKVN
jgi:NAD(P)-dependent dehydrogenase (short-subunit alcohol dehydrogenase family)